MDVGGGSGYRARQSHTEPCLAWCMNLPCRIPKSWASSGNTAKIRDTVIRSDPSRLSSVARARFISKPCLLEKAGTATTSLDGIVIFVDSWMAWCAMPLQLLNLNRDSTHRAPAANSLLAFRRAVQVDGETPEALLSLA
jgi:hypothetical protein